MPETISVPHTLPPRSVPRTIAQEQYHTRYAATDKAAGLTLYSRAHRLRVASLMSVPDVA
eukprot:66262-Rhodomonas_salina.1